jgi:hypothetical protein
MSLREALWATKQSHSNEIASQKRLARTFKKRSLKEEGAK